MGEQGGEAVSGPVRIALEFDVQAAKKEVHKYIQEFCSDPMHWPNNKRRRMGMKPLRKPINTNHRTWPGLSFVYKIVEDSLRGVVPKPVEDFASMVPIEEIGEI